MLPGTGFQNVGVQHIGEPLPLRAGQFFFLFKRYWLSALGMDERQLLSQLILENVPQRDIRVFRQNMTAPAASIASVVRYPWARISSFGICSPLWSTP